jgi:hypothetical protein
MARATDRNRFQKDAEAKFPQVEKMKIVDLSIVISL